MLDRSRPDKLDNSVLNSRRYRIGGDFLLLAIIALRAPCGAAFAVTTFLFSLARGPRARGPVAAEPKVRFSTNYPWWVCWRELNAPVDVCRRSNCPVCFAKSSPLHQNDGFLRSDRRTAVGGEPTFAEARVNGEVAPLPAARANTIDRRKSTRRDRVMAGVLRRHAPLPAFPLHSVAGGAKSSPRASRR
jgi:hypothetical protein